MNEDAHDTLDASMADLAITPFRLFVVLSLERIGLFEGFLLFVLPPSLIFRFLFVSPSFKSLICKKI